MIRVRCAAPQPHPYDDADDATPGGQSAVCATSDELCRWSTLAKDVFAATTRVAADDEDHDAPSSPDWDLSGFAVAAHETVLAFVLLGRCGQPGIDVLPAPCHPDEDVLWRELAAHVRDSCDGDAGPVIAEAVELAFAVGATAAWHDAAVRAVRCALQPAFPSTTMCPRRWSDLMRHHPDITALPTVSFVASAWGVAEPWADEEAARAMRAAVHAHSTHYNVHEVVGACVCPRAYAEAMYHLSGMRRAWEWALPALRDEPVALHPASAPSGVPPDVAARLPTSAYALRYLQALCDYCCGGWDTEVEPVVEAVCDLFADVGASAGLRLPVAHVLRWPLQMVARLLRRLAAAGAWPDTLSWVEFMVAAADINTISAARAVARLCLCDRPLHPRLHARAAHHQHHGAALDIALRAGSPELVQVLLLGLRHASTPVAPPTVKRALAAVAPAAALPSSPPSPSPPSPPSATDTLVYPYEEADVLAACCPARAFTTPIRLRLELVPACVQAIKHARDDARLAPRICAAVRRACVSAPSESRLMCGAYRIVGAALEVADRYDGVAACMSALAHDVADMVLTSRMDEERGRSASTCSDVVTSPMWSYGLCAWELAKLAGEHRDDRILRVAHKLRQPLLEDEVPDKEVVLCSSRQHRHTSDDEDDGHCTAEGRRHRRVRRRVR